MQGVESGTMGARTGRALLSVYRRPDGYYVVRQALTTSDLRVLEGSPAVVVPLEATPEALGNALREAAALDAHRVPHPSREEFTRDGHQRSAALFARAGARSWRSFERGSSLASVERTVGTVTVTPLVSDRIRPDTWSDDVKRTAESAAPDPRLCAPRPAGTGRPSRGRGTNWVPSAADGSAATTESDFVYGCRLTERNPLWAGSCCAPPSSELDAAINRLRRDVPPAKVSPTATATWMGPIETRSRAGPT